MADVKTLINSWKQDRLTNPNSIELAYQAILALEARATVLEAQIKPTSKRN